MIHKKSGDDITRDLASSSKSANQRKMSFDFNQARQGQHFTDSI